MKHKLTIRAIFVPREDAERSMKCAIGLLADALAELAISEARAEVAASLGVNPEQIDREQGRLAEEAEALMQAPGLVRGAR